MKNTYKAIVLILIQIIFSNELSPVIGGPMQELPPMPNLLYEEDFEGSRPLDFAHKQFSEGHSFEVVPYPVYSGSKSGKFELRYGDRRATKTGIRSEVLFPYPDHKERWYSFAVFFPSEGFEKDNDNETFTQWHQSGLGSPSAAFEVRNDRLVFTVANDAKIPGRRRDRYDFGQVPRDSWQEFVFHFVHSHDEDGLLEIWHNGIKVVSRDGGNIYKGVLPRWKIGIYKWTWDSRKTTVDKRILYYDNIRVGNENASFLDMSIK